MLKIRIYESIFFQENLLTNSEWKLLYYDILFGNKYFYENVKMNTNYKIGLKPEIQSVSCFDFSLRKILCLTKGKNFSLYVKVLIANQYTDFYFIDSEYGFFS